MFLDDFLDGYWCFNCVFYCYFSFSYWLANIKIKPVYREIQDCKDRIEQTNTLISINEKRRDESIGYQIKIIEQKIELSRIGK